MTILTLLTVVLIILGLTITVYSSWFQDRVCKALVVAMNNKQGTEFELSEIKLKFPLDISIKGLSLIQDGDTMIHAGSLDASVKLMPLLAGHVNVDRAIATDARYQIGTRDSATCIVVKAGIIDLDPAHVALSPMHITLDNGTITHGVVDIFINPVDTTPPSKSEPTPLLIDVKNLTLNNFTYRMNMMPTIDSLGTHIAHATLKNGHIDVAGQKILLDDFSGNNLDVSYIAPDSATIAATPVVPSPVDTLTQTTKPWEIKLSRLYFDNSRALYSTRGYSPLPGFDPAYISVTDMTLDVEDFYNCGADMSIPVKVKGHERSGLDLKIGATLGFDSVKMMFDDVTLATPSGTDISGQGMLGSGDLMTDVNLPLGLNLKGKIATGDLALAFPTFRAYVSGLPQGTLADLDVNITGTPGQLKIARIDLDIPRSLSIRADGQLMNIFDPNRLSGNIGFDGRIGDLSPWSNLLASLKGVRIPPLSLDGQIKFSNGNYMGTLAAQTEQGSIALDGYFKGRNSEYDIDLTTDNFPVNAFMPELGVGNISAHILASGHGFEIFNPGTEADITADINHIVYNGHSLADIGFSARLSKGHADINATSHNPSLDFDLIANGNLAGDVYDWNMDVNARDVDLQALGLTNTTALIQTDFDLQATLNSKRPTIMSGTLNLNTLTYTDSIGPMALDNVKARIDATDSLINASVSNGDLYAYFSSPMSIDRFTTHFDSIGNALKLAHANRRIDIEHLQRAIPCFNLDINAGNDNILTQLLSQSNISFKDLTIEAYNDTTINLVAAVKSLTMGKTRLDSVTFDIHQSGNRLNYQGRVHNRPGTLDEWAKVNIDGYFRPGRLGLNMSQQNINGNTGYNLGAYIDLNQDSTATLHFSPVTPTIGYKQWTVNDDNFIKYNFVTRHIDANLRMNSVGSSLAIYTEHADEESEDGHTADENLIVKLFNIRLEDWIKLNPFAPPIKGGASADLSLNYDSGRFNINGNVSIADLIYGRERVGNLRADIGVTTQTSGLSRADMTLWVNDHKSMTLSGLLNDSTAETPFNLDLKMIHFPLSTVNPFMPGIARLQGTLNGSLDISGSSDTPRLDGQLDFDSASVRVDMLGTTFNLSPTAIPVKDNIVQFSDFTITGCNENPLILNGSVKIKTLSDMDINLKAYANNMQIVNSTRASKGADVYGRAYISMDGTAKGSLDFININANLTLNSGTNVTYIMPDAVETLTSQANNDMVKFVNFNDSASVAKADSLVMTGMSMNLKALLTIATNTTIGVDLSSNGQDRVQLNATGTLDYSSTPMNDGRLTGRLNINKGYVRYTPPLISQKLFNFNEGSYIAFRGDMMNPQLNISATDHIRANVTQEGQNSRLIYFDVGLNVTGTLNTMDVVFDLSTDDDVTIANELQSMAPSQRASQAINLMLYNVYTGPGTKANANLSGNPLYSFLTSRLNSWAASAIKGVDISFGIDQYNRTNQGVTSQTMAYSYQVSKSLFNDRFKISVGGNYSTDVDADQNLAQNLISDISLEYLLNKSGTMSIKIFRHTGYESILEGEITQTGVGFIYRRKIRRLSDLFRLPRRRYSRPHNQNLPPADNSVTGQPIVQPADTIK